ncbi:hypothetical protein J2W42_005766 [Rhizobium tibeticum]|nr:hypothetical protein [Rhizobium tibeticum]
MDEIDKAIRVGTDPLQLHVLSGETCRKDKRPIPFNRRDPKVPFNMLSKLCEGPFNKKPISSGLETGR